MIFNRVYRKQRELTVHVNGRCARLGYFYFIWTLEKAPLLVLSCTCISLLFLYARSMGDADEDYAELTENYAIAPSRYLFVAPLNSVSCDVIKLLVLFTLPPPQ